MTVNLMELSKDAWITTERWMAQKMDSQRHLVHLTEYQKDNLTMTVNQMALTRALKRH